MTARDEGAGIMGEEAREMLSWLDVNIQRLASRYDLGEQNLRNKYLRLRALLAAPVSAPRFVYSNVEPGDMDYWIAEFGFNRKEDAEAFRRAASTGQRNAAPADGSQVEPSTTGAGGPIPSTPPFIQWNGGENPAPGKVVDYKMRDGGAGTGTWSRFLNWNHGNYPQDIIAYRIIPTDDQGGEGT